jgi:excisionase family DNA binding protein
MTGDSGAVTLVEGAFRLGVSYEVALRMVLTRRLKGERRGRRWLVDREDLERLVRERSSAAPRGTEVA